MGIKLNEKNEFTEKVIHLLVTPLCDRSCKHCCNKQYNLSDIPIVTDEELKRAEVICLTGGEPFKYSSPISIAAYLKKKYQNIKKVYVYTNAYEFYQYTNRHADFYLWIDGVNIGVKNKKDLECMMYILYDLSALENWSNRIYNQTGKPIQIETDIPIIERNWQEEFEPANDSIFRRL